METPNVVFLLRTAASTEWRGDDSPILGRNADPKLSAEGRWQAMQLAKRLACRRVAEIYCSPARRAMETARIIAYSQDTDIVVHSALQPVDTGFWEGRTWDQIQRHQMEGYLQFRENPSYPGGETWQEVQARVLPLMRRVARRGMTQNIAVLTHHDVAVALLAGLLRLPADRFYELDQPHACCNVLRWHRGRFELEAIEDVESELLAV